MAAHTVLTCPPVTVCLSRAHGCLFSTWQAFSKLDRHLSSIRISREHMFPDEPEDVSSLRKTVKRCIRREGGLAALQEAGKTDISKAFAVSAVTTQRRRSLPALFGDSEM